MTIIRLTLARNRQDMGCIHLFKINSQGEHIFFRNVPRSEVSGKITFVILGVVSAAGRMWHDERVGRGAILWY